jgi:N-acetylmuramoyl-L-alanine amidase
MPIPTRAAAALAVAGVFVLVGGCAGSAARSPGSSSASVPHTPAAPAPGPTRAASALPTPAIPAPIASIIAIAPIVVLNPGHDGGNSSDSDAINAVVPAGNGETKACDTAGTTTDDGYTEHEFNFDVAQRVEALLEAHGVRVELTRSNDSGVGPCVDARAALGNGDDVAAVGSIHADGAPQSGHGFHISQASTPPAGSVTAAESDQLTADVHDAMASMSGLTTSTYLGTDGYYPRGDLAGLNLAIRPATFLECGNMRNDGDAALQSSPEGRQQIARAIAAGILTFLGL